MMDQARCAHCQAELTGNSIVAARASETGPMLYFCGLACRVQYFVGKPGGLAINQP